MICVHYRDRYGEPRCGRISKSPEKAGLTINKDEVTCKTCLILIDEKSPVIKSQRKKMRDFIFEKENKPLKRTFSRAINKKREI